MRILPFFLFPHTVSLKSGIFHLPALLNLDANFSSEILSV